MGTPIVSVVIPCYNQGHFLREALSSLDRCDHSLFETIIVNDGSTDAGTIEYLNELQRAGVNVVYQKNMGLGAARNTGISLAKGEYILPLDCDNKILPEYLPKALEILSENQRVAVVYGNASYFGEQGGILRPGRFNLQRLMLGNYIDACAVIRKSVLVEIGGYDAMAVMGIEDWDLWLRIAFRGYGFHYVNEILFEYRVVPNSMLRSLNKNIQKMNDVERYIGEKYANELDFEFVNNNFIWKMKKKPLKFLYRLLLKKCFPRYYQKRIRQNKLYNGWLYY